MLMWSATMLKGMAQQAPPNNGPHTFSLADCIAYAY
ncbi:MAG: hypothetical protein JWO58_3402, partial [Chitinophagaceae bacterium]|nr:hypothetical protein [Chitinophagaceae bacterium]